MWIRIRAVMIEDSRWLPSSGRTLGRHLSGPDRKACRSEPPNNRTRHSLRVGTEITASRTGAARLAAVLKTHR
jgi:hypothetical protein